jgi:hypothetical protein
LQFVDHRFAFDLLDGTYSLNNARNVITLRADLKRAAFDEGHFVFFPYQGKMVTIFMTTETRDLAKDFHFSAAEIPGRIVGDFLYARFAWSIFKISARLLPIYEKDDEVAKVTVPAPLQPKPRQPPQSKKRKREEPGAPEDASDGEDSDVRVAEGGSGERGGDAADEDSANSASEDSFHGEQDLDVYCLTEVDLARADARDAELQRRGPYGKF